MLNRYFNHDGQGRPVLDLRAEAAARRPDLRALPVLTQAERDLAVRTWRERMVNEHLSAQVWASLVPQAMRAAVPPAVLTQISRAISDELRHAEQCAGVVLALGGEAVALLPPVEPVPAHEDAGPVEAFLRNAVSVGCLSETVAVSVIRAEHAEIEGGPLGEVLAGILADEIQHARLGWSILGLLAPRLDEAARERLGAYLVDALAHQVAFEVPRLPVLPGLRPEMAQVGVCDGGFARDLFLQTVEDVIVPQLQTAGLPARAAWMRARAETTRIFA